MGRLSTVLRGLLILLLTVIFRISVNKVRGRPCKTDLIIIKVFELEVGHLSGEVVLYDGEDGESLETGGQVQDEQIIVVLRYFLAQTVVYSIYYIFTISLELLSSSWTGSSSCCSGVKYRGGPW